MSLHEIYDVLKYWLPMVTAFTLIIKAYQAAKKGIAKRLNTLFDNHLSHIQNSTQEMANSLKTLCQSNNAIADGVIGMKSDLQESQKEIVHVQNQILTGIEILRGTQE